MTRIGTDNGEEKGETGNRKSEKVGVLLRALRLRRDKVAKAEMLDFECWILDWQRMKKRMS